MCVYRCTLWGNSILVLSKNWGLRKWDTGCRVSLKMSSRAAIFHQKRGWQQWINCQGGEGFQCPLPPSKRSLNWNTHWLWTWRMRYGYSCMGIFQWPHPLPPIIVTFSILLALFIEIFRVNEDYTICRGVNRSGGNGHNICSSLSERCPHFRGWGRNLIQTLFVMWVHTDRIHASHMIYKVSSPNIDSNLGGGGAYTLHHT